MTENPLHKPITLDDIIQKWFPILGVICIVSSLSYLFYDGIWGNISEAGRLTLGFLAGIAMIGGGFAFESRLKYFADVFLGGGILLLYVTLIYGSRFESAEAALIPEAAALAIAALFAFGVAFYSLVRRAKVILGLGILGAYLTPFFMGQAGSYDSAVSFPAFLLYFAAINVAVLFVSSRLFLKGIALLNALGLFVGTFALSLLRGESFADHLSFSIVFLLFVLAVHTAAITINAKKFEKEYDPFLVSSAIFPFVWFGSLVKFDLASAFTNVFAEGILFLVASAISFVAWYFLRFSSGSDRHYPFYFGGVALLALGVHSLAQIAPEFDGIFLAGLSLLFAILYVIRPLSQRLAAFLGLGIFGFLITYFHAAEGAYPGNLIFFFEPDHAMIILSLLPLLASFFFPQKTNDGLEVFAKVTRFFALLVISLLTILDLIAFQDIPKDLLFFTIPALGIAISLFFESNPGKIQQKVLASFWLGIFGFFITFFTMIDRIYPPSKYLQAFQTEEFLIGALSIAIFAIALHAVRKKAEIFSEGIVFALTFAFYTALFLTVSHEVIIFFNFFPEFIESAEGMRALALALWWAALAIAMMTIGTHREKFLSEKSLGFALLIITIIKIFIYDLGNVDKNLKAILFLVLGILILGLSYFASRKKLKASSEDSES
jgi:uncharacterized membrane protein